MGKEVSVYTNDKFLDSEKAKSELGRIKKMPYVELTKKDYERLAIDYKKERDFGRRVYRGRDFSRYGSKYESADVASDKQLFDEFVAKKVEDWNKWIDRFNNGEDYGILLSLDLCDKYEIEQYKGLKGDLLKHDALLGNKTAALDYAEFVDDKKEKEYYLNIAASKNYWRAIKKLVEDGYQSGEKYKSFYEQFTKLQTTKIVGDVNVLKDKIKSLLANLKENPENAKEIFPLLLSLIGNTQNDDKFNFDSWLLSGRIGNGCGLGRIEWKEGWALDALVSTVKLVGDYSNIKGFMTQSEFEDLLDIANNRKDFNYYLFFAFTHSQGKLLGGGIPTAYETALQYAALNEKKNNLLTDK